MGWLHGGNYVQLGQPVNVAGADALDVLDTVPEGGGLPLLNFGQHVEHGTDGAIADGVDGQADAGRVGTAGDIEEFFFGSDGQA